MDVDLPSSSSKRPADFPPASSSADKRTKTLLPNEQLTTLSSNMDSMKNRRNWQIWVNQAEVDNSRWLDLLSDVLVVLTMELASTNMKDSVIANLTLARAEAIVKNFNEDELEGWKVGVRNGVKRNDWIDLLARPELELLEMPNIAVASLTLPKPDKQQLPDEPEAVEEACPGLTPSSYDYFTPAQHKTKDEEVTQAASDIFGEQSELSTKTECAFLLKCIIDCSEGKLQVAFTNNRNAIKLLRENPKLQFALKKAWRTKDYQEIRKSELLTVPKPDKDIATITPSSSGDSNLSLNSLRQVDGAGPPPLLDTWSPRKETVKELYNVLLEQRLVYVRGTPACGKTTLMLLLDAHIRRKDPLAFVYRISSWYHESYSESEKCIEGIGDLYSEHGGRAFLLFDDAQDTYDDDFLWSQFFKNIVDGIGKYRVVVFCSYGSPNARPVDTQYRTPLVLKDVARMTLWPKTEPDGKTMNGLLLNQRDFNQIIERHGSLNIHSDLSQRIFDWSEGHVGAVVAFLDLILTKIGMKSRMRNGEVLTVETFDKEFPLHNILKALAQGAFGRGIPVTSDLKADVIQVFRRLLKDGAIEVSEEHDPAVHSCHRRGWIYAKEVIKDDSLHSSLFYVFASPLHAVVLSWILHPTDDIPDFRSLFELSMTVISNFKPSQLHLPIHRAGADFSEQPPEAQYRDEFYRCLFDIARGGVRITPEFAAARGARKAGRIDFFIPKVKWGIEFTRDGDRLNEHASRFGANGAYDKWLKDGRMKDYILLDCRTTNVRDPHPNMPFLYHIVFQKEYQHVCVYNNMLEKVGEKDLQENYIHM